MLYSINAAITKSPWLWLYLLNRRRKTDKIVDSIKKEVTIMIECNVHLSEVLVRSVQYTKSTNLYHKDHIMESVQCFVENEEHNYYIFSKI